MEIIRWDLLLSLPTIINCLLYLGGNILLHCLTVWLAQWIDSPTSRIWGMAQWKELKRWNMICEIKRERRSERETYTCFQAWFMEICRNETATEPQAHAHAYTCFIYGFKCIHCAYLLPFLLHHVQILCVSSNPHTRLITSLWNPGIWPLLSCILRSCV